MLVIVCIKEVPDAAYINISPENGLLIRQGVPSNVNPFDVYALEEAIKLKEQHGFRVTTICMGPGSAENTLKKAIAMGVDEAALLSDPSFSGSDTMSTGVILSAAIRKLAEKEEVGLVICGKQTTDGATGLVGPGIATHLKYSQLTLVDQIVSVDPQEKKIKVRRTLDGYTEVIESRLPAVITVVPQINHPREPTVRMQMLAEKAQIPQWHNSDLNLPVENIGRQGSATRVQKIFSRAMPESEIIGDGISDPDGAARQLVDTLINNNILSI